ncbi:coiled-coil domain-containing protein 170-like isoform X1 [Dasypus novemcinctus]|uniref:coiled-coil domain-containing protein 170-like isoform X1 n=1 Tax=Dasypus novemcinctus TaxID=9361 RepID=UPI00265EB554|nr:coiled-coil domain-containing protein 170-like isoform X1 [Dasypus novemcinctus]XP_058150914.1 coiled-coil domain-containing protein 170-like isoform X1 [Dasypus novemcinctus]
MSEPQFLNHSDPGRLATIQSKGPQEDTPSKAKHLSSHTSWKTSPVACFDPPLEVIPSSNPITNSKKAADTGHPDLGGLLVRNKNLSAEVRNLQNKLLIKETSLQEMKSELKTYKENNAQQSYQIMSLKDDIKDLKEINASLIRIKTLKNTNIQILERGNWDLTERIMELENRVRILLVERKKAEHKSDLLETKLAGANRFPSCMNMKGPEDFINMFTMKDKDEAILDKNFEKDNIFHSDGPKGKQKFGDKCQQDLICKEKQIFELERPPYSFIWETKASQSQYQTLLNQLATLLSYSVGLVPATEEAVKEKIQEIGANEQSWKSKTEDLQQEIQILTKQLEELHHLYEETVQSSQAEEKYREQKKSLKCLEGKIDINDFFQGTLDFDKNKENSNTKNSQIAENDKKFKQPEKDMQQLSLNIQQNLQTTTTQILEEKIKKLQKQLTDLKLSNKNMKTQLTKVNVLKEKTIEKLRQSLIKVEMMKEKAVMKTDNLKTTLDSAEQEQEAQPDIEPAQQMLNAATHVLSPAKSTLQYVPGREQELVDFRETITKMLGFNMKTADHEVINQLKLIIQAYEEASKSKFPSDCETGQ